MGAPVALRCAVPAALLAALAGGLSGCGGGAPHAAARATPGASSAAPTAPADARVQLAAAAAAARDRRFAALYTLAVPGRADRTVAVTRAADGGWRVDIPGAALGGTADVSVVRTSGGLYQCALASMERFTPASCVRVARASGRLAASIDPRVEHPFSDWLEVLNNRDAPLLISTVPPLSAAGGTCFSVETTTTSLLAPLDAGIYCFSSDGVLTAARLGFGKITLASEVAGAPPSVQLPGPVVDAEPLEMAAPPAPPTPTLAVAPTSTGAPTSTPN